MKLVRPEKVLNQLQGATIVSTDVTKDGMKVVLQDGRILLVVGNFVVSMVRVSTKELH